MKIKMRFTALLALTSAIIGHLIVENTNADVIITTRESYAYLDMLTQAGGATSTFFEDKAETSLNGSFNFDSSSSVFVTENDPFSLGSGNANGSIGVSETITTFGNAGFTFTANRASSGAASYGSGPNTSGSAQSHWARLVFSVVDNPAFYQLSGNLDPGALNSGDIFSETEVTMGIPFDAFKFFQYTNTSTLSASGMLNPGNYFLNVRMTDSLFATHDNPAEVDASSLSLNFSVTSVPEPSGMAFTLVAAAALFLKRRRTVRLD